MQYRSLAAAAAASAPAAAADTAAPASAPAAGGSQQPTSNLVALLRSRGLIQDVTSEELEKVGSSHAQARMLYITSAMGRRPHTGVLLPANRRHSNGLSHSRPAIAPGFVFNEVVVHLS